MQGPETDRHSHDEASDDRRLARHARAVEQDKHDGSSERSVSFDSKNTTADGYRMQ